MSEQLLRDVPLSVDELLRLDGTVNLKAQAVIDKVKGVLSLGDDNPETRFLASVRECAEKEGRLVWRHKRIGKCHICGFSGDYPMYKSGPNKGRTNWNGPVSTKPGVELKEAFVTINGHVWVGGCAECVERLLPQIIECLKQVPCARPPQLQTDDYPAYKWSYERVCKKCGWRGHEEEMGKERTIMGDGWFPCKCPNCTASNYAFRTEIESNVKKWLLWDKDAKKVAKEANHE